MKMSPDDKMKRDNVLGLIKNPSTRPVVFFTGAILLAVIGISAVQLAKTDSDDVPSSASISKVSSVEHQPGVNSSAEHARLQAEANRRAFEEAQRTGQSSLPSLVGDSSVDEPISLPEQEVPQQPPAQPEVPQVPQVPQQPPVVQPPVVEQPSPTPAQPVAPPQVSDAMSQQILGYLGMWGPANNVYQEYVYAGTKGEDTLPPMTAASGQGIASAQTVQQGVTTNSTNSTTEEPAIRYVRAGTMIPATLITPLNSDAPGPVIAQVTSGPLKGARLIGNMTVNKESLLVSFSQISKPGWPDMYPVSAIGMDLKSSTALATDVNNHYLTKYLGMLTGSYMQGYGQGMQSQNKSIVIDPNGSLIQNQEELSTQQIQKTATGSVLDQIGSDILDRTERPVTIKVEGANGQPYPIKILFMTNF